MCSFMVQNRGLMKYAPHLSFLTSLYTQGLITRSFAVTSESWVSKSQTLCLIIIIYIIISIIYLQRTLWSVLVSGGAATHSNVPHRGSVASSLWVMLTYAQHYWRHRVFIQKLQNKYIWHEKKKNRQRGISRRTWKIQATPHSSVR